jgi:hypothetical protein
MAMIKSTAEIYNVLESALSALDHPVTAAALMENPVVRAEAVERYGSDIQIATNKLSDTLGFMARRNVLERYVSDDPRTTAKWAYKLKPKPVVKTISSAPSLRFSENADGSLTIDFEKFSIVVKPK